MSIRRYGPGKFDTVLDSYVYAVTLDGGADEELGEADTFGWYGLLHGGRDLLEAVEREARENGDELTEEEHDELAQAKGVVIYIDDHGFVSTRYFDDKKALEEEWQGVEDDYDDFLEESEDDATDY